MFFFSSFRLAVKLWVSKTAFVPLVQVVHSGDPDGAELRSFVLGLESDGAIVRTVGTNGMDCALKSQLVRMLAFRLVYTVPMYVSQGFFFNVGSPF